MAPFAEPSARSTSAAASDTPAALTSRRYRALTIGMVALIALCAFEALAVATAMPTVAKALDGMSLYALSFGGTLAASVVGMVIAGHSSDARGPAMALWAGIALFMTGLLIAGLAPNMPWLLCGRIVQGLGSGSISVALYVVVGRTFPAALQPRIFAAFSAAWVVPSLIGPTLSGLIVQHIGWRWVFLAVPLLGLPTMLILRWGLRTAATKSRLDTIPQHTADPRMADHRVAWALTAATSAGLLHIASQLQSLPAIALCAAALIALVLSTQRLLPNGTLLARRGLPSVIALRGIASATFFGAEVFIPLLLSREYGLSPVWAGSVLTIGALGWSAGSWYQGHQRCQWTRSQLLQTGMSLMALGVFLLGAVTALSMLHSATWTLIAMIIGALASWTLTGIGMGLTYPSLSVLTLELSPLSEQGRNSSALQLADALSTASVLAIEGCVFTLLLQNAPSAAYLTNFAITGGLALLGLALSSRTVLAKGELVGTCAREP